MALEIGIETGTKKTFAVALDWPGLARAGRDEDAAIEALLAAVPRYAAVLDAAGVGGFRGPKTAAGLHVAERLPGDATTDFGAPGAIAEADARPATARDVARLGVILGACWDAFDRAVGAAEGRTLASGARGGGRSLAKIRDHVHDAEAAYLRSLGGTAAKGAGPDEVRDAYVEALGARARGELPEAGPRGGRRWPARYAAARAAWHVLDHTWELEDRTP